MKDSGIDRYLYTSKLMTIVCLICYAFFNTVTVKFSVGLIITEGDTGFVIISYNSAISQTFAITVESYQCSGVNVAIRMC